SQYLRELIEQTTGLSGPGQPQPEPSAPAKDTKLLVAPQGSLHGKEKSKAVTKILQVGATDIAITAIPPGMAPLDGQYKILYSIIPSARRNDGRDEKAFGGDGRAIARAERVGESLRDEAIASCESEQGSCGFLAPCEFLARCVRDDPCRRDGPPCGQ